MEDISKKKEESWKRMGCKKSMCTKELAKGLLCNKPSWRIVLKFQNWFGEEESPSQSFHPFVPQCLAVGRTHHGRFIIDGCKGTRVDC